MRDLWMVVGSKRTGRPAQLGGATSFVKFWNHQK
jgi:hypothetical protein